MRGSPEGSSSSNEQARLQRALTDLELTVPSFRQLVTAKTPWQMYCQNPPPEKLNGIVSFSLSTDPGAEEADTAYEAFGDNVLDRNAIGDTESDVPQGAFEHDSFSLACMSASIEAAALFGDPVRLNVRSPHGTVVLEVPSNGNPREFAHRALELAEGDAERVTLQEQPECFDYSAMLSDIFPGQLPNLAALEGIFLERIGFISDEAHAAGLNSIPSPSGWANLHPQARANLLCILEELSGRLEFPAASFEASRILVSIPNYVPHQERGTPEWLWYAKMDALIFNQMTGRAVESVQSVGDLINASRCKEDSTISSEVLMVFLNYSRVLGTRAMANAVLVPFLNTQLEELSEPCLAGLGHEAVLALEAIAKRRAVGPLTF